MSFLSGTASFVDPNGGTTTRDPITYEIIPTPATPIVVNNATFTQLTSKEIAQRDQIQDDSTHKVRIDLTTQNKTINSTYEVTLEGIIYKITGQPKHPVMGDGRITIYLSAK